MVEPAKMDELISMLRDAFADQTQRDGMGLNETYACDDCASDEELAEARNLDDSTVQTPWWEVDEELLQHSYAAMTFLDDAGFRYYAPALMIWSLRNREGPHRDNMVHESLEYQFGSCTISHWYCRRPPGLFTARQREAITAFLEFNAREEEKLAPKDFYSRNTLTYWRKLCEQYETDQAGGNAPA